MDGDTERLSLPDQHEQPLAPRDPRVNQVALQQHVVLRGQRNHHRRELRSLRLVDCDRIGQRASFSTATRFIASNPDSEAAEQAITVANSHAKELSTLLSSTLPSSFVSRFPSNFSFAFSAPLYKWINDTPELITAGQSFEAQTALRRKQSPHNK